MKLNVKLTYKVLILGHKTSYEAYAKLNLLISHIFYAIYKIWLKNDDSKNIMTWVYMELVHWQRIYSYRKQKFTLLKAAYSVTFDLLILKMVFLFFKNTVQILKFR